MSYYKYGDFTLTRKDVGDDICIYVMGDKENFITLHPSGFNGVVSGYIIFYYDHIDILVDEGKYKRVGKNENLRLIDLNGSSMPEIDENLYNAKNNGSLMHFDMYIRNELMINSKIKSNVKAIYDTALLRLENRRQ